MWELEERHLQEKHQLFKQQLKDQYFMQRHQLLKRHEKVRKAGCYRIPEPERPPYVGHVASIDTKYNCTRAKYTVD